jgi:hypothetical protein
MRYEKKLKAKQAISLAEREIEKMRYRFGDDSVPDFVEDVIKNLEKLRQIEVSDLYLELCDVPQRAEKIKANAVGTMARMNEAENEARWSFEKAVEVMKKAPLKRCEEFAPNEVQSAEVTFAKAQELFEARSYFGLRQSIELFQECKEKALSAEVIAKNALAKLRAPYEEKLDQKKKELDRDYSSVHANHDYKIEKYESIIREGERDLSCDHVRLFRIIETIKIAYARRKVKKLTERRDHALRKRYQSIEMILRSLS